MIDWDEQKRLLAPYGDLMERTKMTLTEIDDIARTIVQAEWDPLQPQEWGEVFTEFRRRSIFEDDDFSPTLVDPVPTPNAQVDLRRAWNKFRDDWQNIEDAYRRKLSIEQLLMITENLEHWHAFWSVRDPCPKIRAKLKTKLDELARIMQPMLADVA